MLYIDEEQNIELTRGDTGFFTIALKDNRGEDYTPVEGDTLRFAMSKSFGGDPIILKQIPISTLVLEVEPQDTADLNFGKYVYDVEFTDAAGHVSTIILGNFTLTKEVH